MRTWGVIRKEWSWLEAGVITLAIWGAAFITMVIMSGCFVAVRPVPVYEDCTQTRRPSRQCEEDYVWVPGYTYYEYSQPRWSPPRYRVRPGHVPRSPRIRDHRHRDHR